MDNAKLIVDTCVKYELLPAKRTTPADRNKVSKFKKDLMNSNQPNKQVLIDLCLSLIKDKSQLNDNIETNYNQEFKDIVNSECYLGMTVEDICVSLWRQSDFHIQERKKALEDLYNQKVEYERIIKNKNDMITEHNYQNNKLTKLNKHLDEKNDFLINKLEKYDTDSEEEIDIYEVPLNQMILDEEEEEPIKYDTPEQSEEHAEQQGEEEINTNAEAKAIFDMAEKQHEEKKLQNRKKYGIN
tara:strand:+ start:723 stop:1448 length:726 start_codon:yes stop_codon:yes gene_type:complete